MYELVFSRVIVLKSEYLNLKLIVEAIQLFSFNDCDSFAERIKRVYWIFFTESISFRKVVSWEIPFCSLSTVKYSVPLLISQRSLPYFPKAVEIIFRQTGYITNKINSFLIQVFESKFSYFQNT